MDIKADIRMDSPARKGDLPKAYEPVIVQWKYMILLKKGTINRKGTETDEVMLRFTLRVFKHFFFRCLSSQKNVVSHKF